MADNFELNAGSGGQTIASDDIGGVQYQRVKPVWGPDGTAIDVAITQPLPVEVLSVLPGIWQFGTQTGDGLGNVNMNGNYGSVQDFGIAPAAGQLFQITNLIVLIRDTGSMDSGFYGNNVTLTTGIALHKRTGTINGSSTLIQDLTGGQTVKTNTDWVSFVGPRNISRSDFGQGDEVVGVAWPFITAGVAVTLNGDNNEFLSLRLDDDFSGLVLHTSNFQGYKIQ